MQKNEKPIEKITAIRNTRAGGKALGSGKVYSVPGDVSQADAKTLVKMRKAVIGAVENKDSAKAKDKDK